jgi:hypothetical protein
MAAHVIDVASTPPHVLVAIYLQVLLRYTGLIFSLHVWTDLFLNPLVVVYV